MATRSQESAAEVHFDKIGQIAITVRDLERSRTFYRDVLGMRFLFEAPNMAFFQCGETRLMLGSSPQPASSAGTILYFAINEIEAAHARLKSQNVDFVQDPHLVARMRGYDL